MNSFITQVLNQFSDNITDRIFLMIQEDKELMNEYLNLLDRKNSSGVDLDTLNSHVGKAIRTKFNLDNIGISKKPKSTLIKTYERHITK